MPVQNIQLQLVYLPQSPKQDSSFFYLMAVNKHQQKIEHSEIQALCSQINAFLEAKREPKAHSNKEENLRFTFDLINDQSSVEDIQWLKQVANTTLKNLGSANFNAEFLSTKMSLSRRQLHRKLKSLTGMSPSEYLREARLQRAYLLLRNGVYPLVKIVCYKVGMKDVRHFTGLFKKRFGVSPSDYLQY